MLSAVFCLRLLPAGRGRTAEPEVAVWMNSFIEVIHTMAFPSVAVAMF